MAGAGIALAVVPRFAEYIDSTNMIVNTLIRQMQTGDNNGDRLQAWQTATNEIMLHPYKHTIYLASKLVGDGVLIYTVFPRICAWLKATFDYIRYLYNTSKAYLVAQYPTIKARIFELFESIKTLENSSETSTLQDTFEKWANEFVQKLSTVTTLPDTASIWNMLTALLRFLFGNFLFVTTKLIFNLSETWSIVKMELLKYIVQIIGCTLYYFKKINEICYFSSKTIELCHQQTSDLLALTF